MLCYIGIFAVGMYSILASDLDNLFL